MPKGSRKTTLIEALRYEAHFSEVCDEAVDEIEALRADLSASKAVSVALQRDNKALRAENVRFRHALEHYANFSDGECSGCEDCIIELSGGMCCRTAVEALEDKSK